MIVRVPRRRFFNIPRVARPIRGMGDAPPEPSYTSCSSGDIGCEQNNSLIRNAWLADKAAYDCAAAGGPGSGNSVCQTADQSAHAAMAERVQAGIITQQQSDNAFALDAINKQVAAGVLTQAEGNARWQKIAGPSTLPVMPAPLTSNAGTGAGLPTGGGSGVPASSTLPGTNWFTDSMFGGIPNWMLVAAGVGAFFVFGGKR